MKHILDVSQFTRKMVDTFIQSAHKMKYIASTREIYDIMRGRALVSLYYEPSTRTMGSFQSAMLRLGGTNIFVADKYSSSEKGESLEDTIKTLSCYGSAIVLRHPEKGSSQLAASVSGVPIINAGDGNGEHPTQALLDAYTIHSELGDIGGKVPYLPMRILFVGDLKNSRTVHSLVQLLSLYDNIEFIYISPKGLEMPAEITEKVKNCKIQQITDYHLVEAISMADVLYVTRIQRERFDSETTDDARNLSMQYQITPEILAYAKSTMIIMHPFPRNDEIVKEVDQDPRAKYFKQIENGLYMRMAILEWVMKY
jgi:aspartate carbamoyltransferase